MKPEEQKIKNIIDKVFDKYKKVLKGTLMWKWEDKRKICEDIIDLVTKEFPGLKGKENLIDAKLMARFIHTKKNYPFKEFFTIDKAFDVTPESILELIEENISTFNKYLNIINESKNNNWKNEITDIFNFIFKKFKLEEDFDGIKEITNSRIILLFKFENENSNVEINFSDIEIALRRNKENWKMEFESKFNPILNDKKTCSIIIPRIKAEEIIKIWKNRK